LIQVWFTLEAESIDGIKTMRVAAGRITLDFYNNENLTLKHKNLEKLCKDLRKKFNVSALEVDEFDDPEKCVLGFSATIPSHWKSTAAKGLIETICREIDNTAFARVVLEDCDILSLD
jgi:uncharacterized protein YlxP (DUF503 family)